MSENLISLLRAAQAGNREALNALLEHARPHLEASARQFADRDRAAESVSDLVQEAGVLAWKNLSAFQGGPTDAETEQKLLAWLAQIVRRAGIDARRAAQAQRRRPEGPVLALHAGSSASSGFQPPAGDPTPSANVRRDEESELVQRALAQLPDEESRQLLRLVFMQGQSLRQAATEMGLTYDQARHRYHTALGALQEALKRLE
jgi:RNA polymerase sigma factor (sigma-70 family)